MLAAMRARARAKRARTCRKQSISHSHLDLSSVGKLAILQLNLSSAHDSVELLARFRASNRTGGVLSLP